MEKEFLEKVKETLEKEKEKIEKYLSQFAREISEDEWETIYPKSDGSSGSALAEMQADEIEEYLNLLSLEDVLETKLKNINLALKKIEEGTYGICENCKKEIEKDRLLLIPEARFCKKCKDFFKSK